MYSRIFNGFLFFYFTVNYSESQNSESWDCTLPNGKSSTCERLHHCTSIWNIIKQQGNVPQTRDLVQQFTCPNLPSFVCCPDTANQEQYEQTSAPEESEFRLKTVSSKPPSSHQNQNVPSSNQQPINNDNLHEHPSLNLINRADCGVGSYNEYKNTNNQEFPWMVQLRFNKIDNGTILGCSGTLISDKFVLTSASCLTGRYELISVRLGQQILQSRFDCDDFSIDDCDNSDQDIIPEKVFRHENFDSQTYANNIALIKLSKSANIRGRSVRTICLPTEGLSDIQLHQFMTSGWKKTEKENLFHGFSSKIESEVCENAYKAIDRNFVLQRGLMCGEIDVGRETCDILPGSLASSVERIGPVFKVVQYGVGWPKVECGKQSENQVKVPDIYTDVTQYITWILNKMQL